MNKWVGISFVTLGLLAGVPETAFAGGHSGNDRERVASRGHGQNQAHNNRWRRWHHDRGLPAASVPELDPGTAAQAFALLLAGSALLIERRRAART